MVKNRIIVSDANIFIDLLQVELLEAFFALTFSDCEIWTTDFVYREVKKVGKVHVLEKFTQTDAADNLEALMDENPRLPRQICEQKISAWRSA